MQHSTLRRRMDRLAAPFCLLLVLLSFPAALLAQNDQLDATLGQLQAAEQRIEALLQALDTQPEEHRDALLFRIDERLLALVSEMDAKALELAGVDEDSLESESALAIIAVGVRVLELALTRVDQINQRIAEAREEISEFEASMRGNVAQSFVQEQQMLRYRYLQLLIEYLQVIENLAQQPGFPEAVGDGSKLRESLEAEIDLLAERTAGQIRLDAATLVELRSRLAESPLDQDLQNAVQAVQRKQSRSLASLEATIALLESLGLDAAEFRALIVRQRGVIGIELLQRQVFAHVMREQLESAQQRIVSTGPNLILRTLIFLLILAVAWVLAGLARKLMRAFLSIRHVTLTRLSGEVLVSVIGIVVFLFGLIVALSSLGVSVGPMLAGLGIAGIIIGFALQDSLGMPPLFLQHLIKHLVTR